MPYDHIAVLKNGAVATLVLNRPETRNAMTPDMGDEVVRATAALRDDPEVRVVVLTGAGQAFCAGGDLGMLARDAGVTETGPTIGTPRDFYARFLSIRSLPMPTIAAVNGHAIGAGLCLALACDMRIAVATARMGMTFGRLGIHPGMGGTFLLPRLVGTSRACDLFFTGRLIDAVEAERMGVVNRVVPPEDLETAVGEVAAEIASCAPVAVRMMKKAIYRGTEHSLEDMLDFESLQQSMTFRTEDAREGVRAVMERRPPSFVGR